MRNLTLVMVSLVMASLTSVACADPALPPLTHHINFDSALGQTIARDTSPPLQTDSLVQRFRGSAPSYSVVLPFRYRNDTGRTVHVENCRGMLGFSLEKRVDHAWELFLVGTMPRCYGSPIVIEPGEVFVDTARIGGTLPGQGVIPSFASAELDGEYRLVWYGHHHAYDARDGTGIRLDPVRSNPFLLVLDE